MADKISDNVGKKIVEALRMQNQPVEDGILNSQETTEEIPVEQYDEVSSAIKTEEENTSKPEVITNDDSADIEETLDIDSILNNTSVSDVDNIFQNTLNQNLGNINIPDVKSDFEYPKNVTILTHLLSKLPTGVPKQTGALIIRQTMEALGIPMKSVLNEAQQVQESLILRARECQKNIIDYKKQIATLEIKGQQYQKQAVSMNDFINLFLNTGV